MPLSLFLPGYSMNSKLESREATIIIGWYTFVLHFLLTFYFLDVYRGSSSDQVISPIFEYSDETMYTVALIAAIYCIIYTVAGSLGLIRGVKSETRIFYFPWFIFTAFEIVLIFYRVVALWWRYSYDTETNVAIAVTLLFASYHVYLYLIVLSNYRYLKKIQSPTLIFPPEM